MDSGGSSLQYLRGMVPCEHGSASLYCGSGSRAPSGVQGQSPWSEGSGGGASPEVKALGFWMFNGSRKCSHFSKIWTRKEIVLCYLCKKSSVATKWGGGGLKQNWGPVHPPPRPGPKTATACKNSLYWAFHCMFHVYDAEFWLEHRWPHAISALYQNVTLFYSSAWFY